MSCFPSFYLSLIVNRNATDDLVSLIFGIACFHSLVSITMTLEAEGMEKATHFLEMYQKWTTFTFVSPYNLMLTSNDKIQFLVI